MFFNIFYWINVGYVCLKKIIILWFYFKLLSEIYDLEIILRFHVFGES